MNILYEMISLHSTVTFLEADNAIYTLSMAYKTIFELRIIKLFYMKQNSRFGDSGFIVQSDELVICK